MSDDPAFTTAPNDQNSAKLFLVDVGGAGGLDEKWSRFSERITPVLFEPNPEQAEALRLSVSTKYSSALVVEAALSNIVGPKTLNIARFWGCTSLRSPNQDVLAKYRISSAFEVIGTASIECQRYDELHRAGKVPTPDAIKIDVQGYEYEALMGFGGLLQNCLSIELETHLYPIYKDQKLLHDIISFLSSFSFVLRKLNPVASFDGDVVELDAWFTKDITAWRLLNERDKEKFTLICEACELVDYNRIDPAASHDELVPNPPR